jgi:putative SOS response-associated peptidase YedK
MCFSVSVTTAKVEKIGSVYGEVFGPTLAINLQETEAYTPYFFVSGFSFPRLPVITQDGISLYNWGLIPHWIHDYDKAMQHRHNTLNAVSETIFEKASFKEAIKTQRCIIPVNGFFEWKTVEKEKIPYFIQPTDGAYFSLAGIYNSWHNRQTNEIISTFSILTTPANELMAEIHNLKKRMPLIIQQGQEPHWVQPTASTASIRSMMQPYDYSRMKAYTISKMVNNSRNNRNVPEILRPVEYSQQRRMTL